MDTLFAGLCFQVARTRELSWLGQNDPPICKFRRYLGQFVGLPKIGDRSNSPVASPMFVFKPFFHRNVVTCYRVLMRGYKFGRFFGRFLVIATDLVWFVFFGVAKNRGIPENDYQVVFYPLSPTRWPRHMRLGNPGIRQKTTNRPIVSNWTEEPTEWSIQGTTPVSAYYGVAYNAVWRGYGKNATGQLTIVRNFLSHDIPMSVHIEPFETSTIRPVSYINY